MGRKNIFDLLFQDVSIGDQLNKIEELLSKKSISGHTLEYIVDTYCLQYWKYRGIYTTCSEIRKKLHITLSDISIDFPGPITVLNYLEYLSNIIWLCETKYFHESSNISRDFQFLKENVENFIESLNYEVIHFEDGRNILAQKDAGAMAAAEIAPIELSEKILEYNHFILKGDLDEKRKILLVLADFFEGKKAELEQLDLELENNIGFLLNNINIRHNNREGAKASSRLINMTNHELEEWYDDTYQMLLLSILELDNKERNLRVETLRKQFKDS